MNFWKTRVTLFQYNVVEFNDESHETIRICHIFLLSYSSLVFAGANTGDIVRYFIDAGTQEVVFNNNTSPKCLSVDSEYEAIYWSNYIDDSDSYSLMKTYFNGTTSKLKDYPGPTSPVKIAIGEDDFYVLDSTRGRIDRFDRESSSLQHSFLLGDTPSELTVVRGKR